MTAGALSHVVLVEWRDDLPHEALQELEKRIDGFSAGIPGIVSLARGASVSPEGLEGGFGWALVIGFEDAAARDGYLPHELHIPVAALIGEWSKRVVVFDV